VALEHGRTSLDSVAQGATLAAPGGALRLAALTWDAGRVLPAAHDAAVDHDVAVDAQQVWPEDAAAYLVQAAPSWDLVALRAGDTAYALVPHFPVPLLVVRPAPAAPFPDSVLLAVDGTPSCLTAAAVAGRIAAAHSARTAIVSAPGHDLATRRILRRAADEVRTETGTEPVILDEVRAAHRSVAAAARGLGASLIVTGSRGLTGAAARHSVSRRIVRAAPCSVLVVPGAA
jgi:nucleotide-binding universal stress UspA family protein